MKTATGFGNEKPNRGKLHWRNLVIANTVGLERATPSFVAYSTGMLPMDAIRRRQFAPNVLFVRALALTFCVSA